MKRCKMIVSALLVGTLVLGGAGFVPAAHADGANPAAPPAVAQVIHPFTDYSGYTYLLSSTRSLTDNKNQTMDIAVTTQAKSTVGQIGARIQLQEWTGTAWVNIGSQTDYYSTNTSYFQKTVTKAVQSGHYYRASVLHYVTQSGVTEQAQEYTNFLIAS